MGECGYLGAKGYEGELRWSGELRCSGDVTALNGLHETGLNQETQHHGDMRMACGMGSSQVMSPDVLLRAAGRSRTVQLWRPAAATMAKAVAAVPRE